MGVEGRDTPGWEWEDMVKGSGELRLSHAAQGDSCTLRGTQLCLL